MEPACRDCNQWECCCLEKTMFPVEYDPAYGLFVAPDGSVPLVLGSLYKHTSKEKHEFGKLIAKILNEHLCK